MSAAPSALHGEGFLTAESELRPSGEIKECGRITPSEAKEGLEGGFTAGFPPSTLQWKCVEREALEALLPAASGEQNGSLPSGSVCGFANVLPHSLCLHSREIFSVLMLEVSPCKVS